MKRILMFVTGILSCAMLSAPSAPAEEMTLFVMNVGKADCMLLRSGKSAYLIDTGRGNSFEVVESALASLGVSRLDGVIITHTDSDHVGGLKKLLKTNIQIDHLYTSYFYLPEKENKENPVLKAADKQDITVSYLMSGDSLPLDGGTLDVIGPLRAATDKEDNNSLVLFVQAAGGSILLAGDMEFPEESDLLSAGVIPSADILKVANHADGDATSEALMNMVQPQVAIISTSTKEKPDTPSPRVLRLLKKWNAEIWQTQEADTGILVTVRDGDISVISQ